MLSRNTPFLFRNQPPLLRKVLMALLAFPALKTPFLFLFFRTRHRGVGQRSGTGLETPLLSWVLPLKILNYMSLGVDVPLFSTRVKNFFSLLSLVVFLYCLPLTVTFCKYNEDIALSFLLITFYLGSTQSLFRLFRDVSDPALCQERVAICTQFLSLSLSLSLSLLSSLS